MYEKYAKLRDERELTDYRVSMDTGVSAQTISAWKKGDYTPKLDKIKKLADYFGVSIEELIGD